MAQSSKGHPDFVIEFMEETLQFADAIKAARRIALINLAGKFEHRMYNGHDEPVFFQGKPTWVEDESLVGLDDETLKILGLPDRFLRVNGKRVQHVIHHEPPIAGQIKILEAHFKQYAQKSELNINQKVSGGVTVVDARKPKTQALPLPVAQIAAPSPPVQEVAEPPEEYRGDDVANDDDDDDLSDILGEAKPIEAGEIEAQPEPEPKPLVTERLGFSDLERDLLARLRAGPANPRPTAIVNTGNSGNRADDPPERTGA